SSTGGGNPVASAAVTAVLEIFEEEALVENARHIGARIKEQLLAVAERSPYLGDVRGRGMVLGLELVRDKQTKQPAPELVRKLIVAAAQRGLLIGSVGVHGNVIRMAPPLCMTEAEADESVVLFEEALQSIHLGQAQ